MVVFSGNIFLEGQESDPDEEIFLDNKKLKELYPIKKVDIPQAI